MPKVTYCTGMYIAKFLKEDWLTMSVCYLKSFIANLLECYNVLECNNDNLYAFYVYACVP